MVLCIAIVCFIPSVQAGGRSQRWSAIEAPTAGISGPETAGMLDFPNVTILTVCVCVCVSECLSFHHLRQVSGCHREVQEHPVECDTSCGRQQI